VIFHTAAYFREYYNSGDDSDAIELTNVRGTLELAQAAHAMGVRKMIFTSSAGISGRTIVSERFGHWSSALLQRNVPARD
jgi:nucleoside-diphosphate-sugar epimerase